MDQHRASSNHKLLSGSLRRRSGTLAWLVLVMGGFAWPACAAESRPAPAAGAQLAMGFELIENQHEGKEEFLAELTLTNHGGEAPGRRGLGPVLQLRSADALGE